MVSALVIIDVQQGMFALPYRLHDGEKIVERLSAVLHRARAKGRPIFHVRHEGAGGFERDAPGWFHHQAVAPRDGEVIIDKRRSSAFHETDFHARLQSAGIDHLVIGGMQTQMCVESMVRGAVARLQSGGDRGRPHHLRHAGPDCAADHRASQFDLGRALCGPSPGGEGQLFEAVK
jgi:nicotinamidase-related amidase